MNRNEYNGWTNYETWAVNLWLDNEQSSYNAARETAQEAWDNAEADLRKDGTELFSRLEVATRNLAETLKDEHEGQANELAGVNGTVFGDLLSAALSEVDWYEIAKHYMEDVEKTEPPEFVIPIFNENCTRAGQLYPWNPRKEDRKDLEANGDITLYEGNAAELKTIADAQLGKQSSFAYRLRQTILEAIGQVETPETEDSNE